ncbi:PREDICTED: acyl-coenzyme A amino acid N-acyltransferase 1-like [Priapulus caudatus]|uniref:Acyl-coenzyme A amino acid N-acyltransferase 1-like n=1 Tax=Priapulus caudatus TaxID=37621 RepID=A0ABM1EQU0_PRICU|nr:PREDICTED: acyl-coenzyme A amino acid N-acyltransferase 1-like [Priapulus caudatus]
MTLSVIPRRVLVDEVIKIVVNKLMPRQKVTIITQLEEDKKRFYSYANFEADRNGVVDLGVHPSLSGSYTGVMPMGLFCSMLPVPGQKKGLRLIKKDVTTAMTFDIGVYDGVHHVTGTRHTTPLMSCGSVERSYLAEGVTVQEVEQGNIRGKLFLPKGAGPFPGVIDMFGTMGNIITFRSALLASRGFATLALPYLHYKDLPKYDYIHIES